jgi:hypothetical protein
LTVSSLSGVRKVGQGDLERVISEKDRKKVFGGTSCLILVFMDTEESEEHAKDRLDAVRHHHRKDICAVRHRGGYPVRPHVELQH